MSVCCECCVSSLRRADHSSRGFLLNVVCLECDCESSIMRSPLSTGAVAPWGEKNQYLHVNRAVGNLTTCIPVNNYSSFMELEGLLQCLQ